MVDFWAEWCGPCRMIAPIMEEISHEFDGKVLVVKCDVDSSPGVSAKYSIRNIPTVFFSRMGKSLTNRWEQFQKITLLQN